MSYGMRIRNTANELMIDGSYVNYKLDGSGTVSLTPTGTITVDNKVTPPIAIIRPTVSAEPVSLVDFQYSAGVFTSVLLSTRFDKTSSVDWKLYTADGDESADEEYGLRIRNENGQIVFDSNFSYFKIKKVESFTPPAAWDGYVDINHAGIENPYYIITPGGRKIAPIERIQPVPDLWGYFGCVLGMQKLSSESIRIRWVPVRAFASTIYPTYHWAPTNKLVICVP